jgi:hypothetical protein
MIFTNKLIIANEGHRLAIRVQCELAEHGLHLNRSGWPN